ncbi:MAG TPA: SSI family serine proteinase inhibitor [Gaiellaceae bacterium]|nr:SSI family serine proteinase inhibitor [Gaiellaceae bacterium]
MVTALVALALTGAPSTQLSVTVWPQGRTQPGRTWALRCGPVSGTLPGRTAACRRLAAFRDNPFLPVPSGSICTQIYGGPREALVRGTFRGRRVWTAFRRRNGCEIARWERVAFLFPARL